MKEKVWSKIMGMKWFRRKWFHQVYRARQLYLLILIPVIYLLVFKYYPMYGAQIAFKDYNIIKGIHESEWVGFKHFIKFFSAPNFWLILTNTLGLSLYSLVAGFPIPIMLAISLNYLGSKRYKSIVQQVIYAPHFISTVVMVGMIIQFLSPYSGLVNNIIDFLGGDKINFMAQSSYFKSIYVWSDIWQHSGYYCIIYLAALAGIDPQLHEAAIVDGASKFQRIRHIDLPGIMPTAIILLILSLGRVLDVGFEKVLLLQNDITQASQEIISTYVYRKGILSPIVNFSYPTAVGLFKAVVSLVLIVSVNQLARKYSESSLF